MNRISLIKDMMNKYLITLEDLDAAFGRILPDMKQLSKHRQIQYAKLRASEGARKGREMAKLKLEAKAAEKEALKNAKKSQEIEDPKGKLLAAFGLEDNKVTKTEE